MLGGYANKIGFVDLTACSVEFKDSPEDWKRKYVGARGLGVKYVFENGADVDPLSPDNILCFMNGPLTGSAANMSGRLAVVTKSPLTGTVTDSHMGGWSAARLRWAGFDGMIFSGKSDKPVYAYVTQEKVELLDASDVWGKGKHETVKYFQDKYGEKELSVMTIGQAGENLSRFACWINEDDRASGRGGTGCVGGSKNLKAIVINAKKSIVRAADSDKWKVAPTIDFLALITIALRFLLPPTHPVPPRPLARSSSLIQQAKRERFSPACPIVITDNSFSPYLS
jgi:aldehyde:ferredoxin oxidoreductase